MSPAARLPVLSCLVLLGMPSTAVAWPSSQGEALDTGAPEGELEQESLKVPGLSAGWRPVVGGSQVQGGAWPDTAGVVIGGQVSCTGTLIAPDLVITAGHCIGGITSVILDTNDYQKGGEQIRVTKEIEYPSSWTTEDIGLLILEQESTVEPRTIAQDCVLEELYDGAPVTIVGYGATDIWGTQYGSKLMEAETTVTDHDCSELSSGCNKAVSPGGEIAAGGDGVDACYGDSGGPLYLDSSRGHFLVGVTSRAFANVWAPCEEGGIYGRPDAVVDWIEQKTGRVLARPDCEDGGGDSGGGDSGGGDGGGGSGSGDTGGGSGSGDTGNRAPKPSAEPIEVVQGGSGRTIVRPGDPDEGDSHSFSILHLPSRGEAALTPEGLVLYEAPADWSGDDVMEVVVVDQAGEGTVAAIAIRVKERSAEEGAGCRVVAVGAGGSLWMVGVFGVLGLRRRR